MAKPDISLDIQKRFYSLLIQADLAKEAAGKPTAKDIAASNKDDSSRELLRVEKLRRRNEDLNKKSQENFRSSLLASINAIIEERIVTEIEDIEHLMNNLVRYDHSFPTVIDFLNTNACSVGKLEEKVKIMRWLHDEVIRMVNLPQYRKTDRLGRGQRMESLKMALGHIGIENLKQVLPSLALRRMIPQITDPYPLLKKKLWEHSLGTAIIAKHMAEFEEENGPAAFIAGMFHEIGKMALCRTYFRTFDEVQREALHEAHEEKKIDDYDGLRSIQPSGEFLVQLFVKYSPEITARAIDQMEFQRINIKEPMREFCEGIPVAEKSALGRIIQQANAYSEFRMLKSRDLINLDEAKAFIKANRIRPGTIAHLRTVDMKRLNLTMDDE